MKKWYLVETDDYYVPGRRSYHVPQFCYTLGRIIGLLLMFGGGFVIGQVVRGLIGGALILLGII